MLLQWGSECLKSNSNKRKRKGRSVGVSCTLTCGTTFFNLSSNVISVQTSQEHVRQESYALLGHSFPLFFACSNLSEQRENKLIKIRANAKSAYFNVLDNFWKKRSYSKKKGKIMLRLSK